MKKQSANTLYISYDGLTDPLGQSQVIPYLQGLAASGITITVISAEKYVNYKSNFDQIKDILSKSNITWHYIFYKKKPLIVSTLLDIIKLTWLAKRLNRNKKFQIVHCRSYIAMLIGVRLKNVFKCKLIFDMRGFWPDERMDGGIWNEKNFIYRVIYSYFKKQEKLFIRTADAIIVLTHSAKEIVRSWKIAQESIPIKVIPCSVDVDHFQLKNKYSKEIRKTLDIGSNDFVISYVGSLGTWYMLEEMLSFFKVLSNKKNNARFLFLTKDNPSIIYSMLGRLNIDRHKISVFSSDRNKLPELISISDISIFFILPTFSKQASSPTKQGELLSMGIPIITNQGVGDNNYYFSKYPEIGRLIYEMNEKGYSSAVDNIDQLCKTDMAKIREVARMEFNLDNGVENYYNIYSALLD